MELLSGSEVGFEVEAGGFKGDGRGGGAVVEEQARGEEGRGLGQVGRHFLFEDGAGELIHRAQLDRGACSRAPDGEGDQSGRHDRETGAEIPEGWRAGLWRFRTPFCRVFRASLAALDLALCNRG